MNNILVTGGSGFIGGEICRRLRELNCNVRVLDLKYPLSAVEGVEYRQGDIRIERQMLEALCGIDAVYHLAAIVSVPLCQANPAESYATNLNGTLTVLEAIRKLQQVERRTIRIAFASTAALYGNKGNSGAPLTEEDASCDAISFYAAQKLASEQAIRLYHRQFGIPAFIFRFFNVFGKGQDPHSPYSGVITVFAERARNGQPLFLYAGGTPTRDFISVSDIAHATTDALRLAEQKWDAPIVNLGSGRAMKIRELAELINAKSKRPVNLVDLPPRSGDVLHSCADTSRARELLGFAPLSELDREIDDLLATTA